MNAQSDIWENFLPETTIQWFKIRAREMKATMRRDSLKTFDYHPTALDDVAGIELFSKTRDYPVVPVNIWYQNYKSDVARDGYDNMCQNETDYYNETM